MSSRSARASLFVSVFLFGAATSVVGQSFRVQCPSTTITHPQASETEPQYIGPTTFMANSAGYLSPSGNVNGTIKCQQISGGDGYATMGDGTQTYMFSFGPLSGLAKIAAGQPGSDSPSDFNTLYSYYAASTAGANPYLQPGDPATTNGASDAPYSVGTPGTFSFNGAVGLAPNTAYIATIYDISEVGTTVTVVVNEHNPFKVGDQVVVCGTGTYAGTTPATTPRPPCGKGTATLNTYDGTWSVTAINIPNPYLAPNYAFQFTGPSGQADVLESATATASSVSGVDGHVETRPIIDVGVMNGNIPAPLMAIDEDDEFFLTLTNVGMIMRPDLFEQHTVHFHGYPNASAFYDGVPDASVAINIGGSFTYYYLAPDAGTYFWHCHITPPEHLQMGMVGQIYVRPRQDRVPAGTSLYAAFQAQQGDLRTACTPKNDILCTNPLPAVNTGATAASTVVNGGTQGGYAYNDGDGSTFYNVEYPIQI